MAEWSIRLDRFLWFARITKTRSLAQALAAQGRLRIDGRPVTPRRRDLPHRPAMDGKRINRVGAKEVEQRRKFIGRLEADAGFYGKRKMHRSRPRPNPGH